MDGFQPVTVSRRSSVAERQAALYQIYRQVLERQPYSSEHEDLSRLEKDFLADKIGVRRFLKELGHSEIYLDAFYYRTTNPRFLETCFKHFLGRAPIDREEIQLYCDVLMKRGVTAVVTALLDSEEYRKVFGCFTVPYPREPQQYASPKAYLDTQILNHEVDQQVWHMPLVYRHRSIQNSHTATHSHPETNEILGSVPTQATDSETLQAQLLEILKALDVAQAREVIATLSPTQKQALRKAIRR